jgi:CDP-diacylglycerol--glycerol-3-phosphate 3-phosphatidyltransferase
MGMRTTDALKQPDSIANFNLPNFLTVVRILLIPVFVVLFSDPTPDRSLAAAIVFVVAAVTDLLDGYLARRHSQITRLGRLLDPIADKLLVLSGLILLVQFDRVAAIVAILIIAREVAVTGVRAISAAQGIILEAETTGKYKMVVQVVAIVLLLLEDGSLPVSWHPHEVGTGLLYVALALALYSGQRYLVSFWHQSSTKGL